MNDQISMVKALYDASALYEWERLDRNPFEFAITKRMLSRYIKAGDTVLDIGGGPGRYSLWLAEQGCSVTLVDLSDSCVDFAKRKGDKGMCDL